MTFFYGMGEFIGSGTRQTCGYQLLLSSRRTMSSSFLKTSSPYSSSYGHYGAGTVNPYASYFGPAQSSSPSHPSSATSPVSSPFGGSSLAAGPGGGFSMMNQATSPISSPYGYSAFNSPGRPGGISGGSPSYLVPQPTQTKIIGGVNTSGFVGGSSHLGRTTTGTSPTAPSMYGSAFSSPLTGHVRILLVILA